MLDISFMPKLTHVHLVSPFPGFRCNVVPHKLPQLLYLELIQSILLLLFLQHQQLLLLFHSLLLKLKINGSYFLLPKLLSLSSFLFQYADLLFEAINHFWSDWLNGLFRFESLLGSIKLMLKLSKLVLLWYVLLVVPSENFLSFSYFFIHGLSFFLYFYQFFLQIIYLILILLLGS